MQSGCAWEENKDKTETTVMFFRRDNLTPEIADKLGEIRRLLKLPEGQQQFNLVYSPSAVVTANWAWAAAPCCRSWPPWLLRGCAGIDLKDGRATPSVPDHRQRGQPGPGRDQGAAKRSRRTPFAAVHYRNHWFWVDDRDWRTEAALTAVMFLFTMAETGADEKLPLITIPAQ